MIQTTSSGPEVADDITCPRAAVFVFEMFLYF
jgi:hypothetical protein